MRIPVTIMLAALAGVPASAQLSDRDSVAALTRAGRTIETIPLLERLVAAVPTDHRTHDQLGFALLLQSASLPEAHARKTMRARAGALLRTAVALGARDPQTTSMAEAIPEDGGDDAVFSRDPAVNEAMRLGEVAYSTRDYRGALAHYQRALALDPTQYDAALFSGDVYMQAKPLDSAYIWYARATEILPDRETAWRYWSNVLRNDRQYDAALGKAIEALVAEPYSRVSRAPLQSWAQATRTPAWPPSVQLNPTDSSAVRSAAGAAYDSVRAEWRGASGTVSRKFAAAYPAETAYRHSLAEELDALRAAARADGTAAGTANLRKMDEAGVLEAYILFLRADTGIAKDYDAYRKGHRANLRAFWNEWVIGGKYR